MNSLNPRFWQRAVGGHEFKIMRLQETAPPPPTQADTPAQVAAFLGERLPQSPRYNPDVENLGVVHLNVRHRIIGWEIISNGTLSECVWHPRELFKSAIIANSSAIILFHNHPSGDPSPSEADIRMTRQVISAGQVLKIHLLDHLVLGHPDFRSLKELGYIQ
jgi:DNA repair protein RadC